MNECRYVNDGGSNRYRIVLSFLFVVVVAALVV